MTERPSGIPKLGADGGEHDDLVIALALACWQAMRPQNGLSPMRLPGINKKSLKRSSARKKWNGS